MAHPSKCESKASIPQAESASPYEDALRPALLTRTIPSLNTLPQPEVFRSLSSAPLDAPVYRSVLEPFASDLSLPSYKSLASSDSYRPKGSSTFYPDPKSSGFPFKSYGASASFESAHRAPEKECLSEPPSAPGGYLEPSYHFISRAKPVLLLQAIVCVVQSNGIDCAVNYKKYRVKCVLYPIGESKIPFIASVFKMDPDKQGKRYAVELQRRSGDVIHFSGFWAISRRYFVEQGLLDKDKDKEIPKKIVVPKLDVAVTNAQIKETLKCLLQMASSSCCDVKSQAIAALAKMSTDAQVQKVMIEEACLDVLMDALSSKMEDIHRCAVYTLANLAQDDSICRSIVEKGGIRVLCSLSRSSANQVVRDCSRALGLIATTLGSSVVDDEFRETMIALRCSSDPFTQQAARQLEALHL